MYSWIVLLGEHINEPRQSWIGIEQNGTCIHLMEIFEPIHGGHETLEDILAIRCYKTSAFGRLPVEPVYNHVEYMQGPGST
jgi:hypothetical protein